MYHKIKNISGNIGVMLLKLCTSNVPPLCCCHDNGFAFGSILYLIDILIFSLNQTSFDPMSW